MSVYIGSPQSLTGVCTAATGLDLSIDFGNGTVLDFGGLQGTDVLNVTMAVAEVGMIWQGDLVFVTSINGVANNPSGGRWWQYWVNGELGGVAANMYQLLDSDSVVWRLAESGYSDDPDTPVDAGVIVVLFGAALVGVVMIMVLYRRTRPG